MKLNALKRKTVISIVTGEVLGKIVDVEINPNTYCIDAIYIRKKAPVIKTLFNYFFLEPNLLIDTKRIRSLGSDVILVDKINNL